MSAVLEVAISNWSVVFISYRLLNCCPIENVWPMKTDFGRPNAEIDQKMANGD